MPWDTSHANGFTTAALPWLHAHDRPHHQTVEVQQADPTAPVHRYRKLLTVRKARPDFWESDVEWLNVDSETARAVHGLRLAASSGLALVFGEIFGRLSAPTAASVAASGWRAPSVARKKSAWDTMPGRDRAPRRSSSAR